MESWLDFLRNGPVVSQSTTGSDSGLNLVEDLKILPQLFWTGSDIA